MKQVFLSGRGEIAVMEVPIPAKMPGSILVRNEFSLISTGTEGSAVSKYTGWRSTIDKLVSSRNRADEVWKLVKTSGLPTAVEIVSNTLRRLTAIGYSSAGHVVEIENESLPFHVGQRVACMGVGFASHAEYVAVPKNLAVAIPDGVASADAAFGALACIALQGIRRLELTAGEWVGVLGLGLIGQLCVRLLNAMGYRPIGIDLDPQRAVKAAEVENALAWAGSAEESVERIGRLTAGRGLDGAIVAAATRSDEPVNLAFDLSAPGGRVSLIGDVGLTLDRSKMYAKELELRISRSYGPGRYDPQYEEGGKDYPVEYVRWTERRNLGYFLDLVDRQQLSVSSLLSGTYRVENAHAAYARVKEKASDTFGILLRYGNARESAAEEAGRGRTLRHPASSKSKPGHAPIRIAIVGVGGHATNVHIPNLRRLSDRFSIQGLADQRGAASAAVTRRFGIPLVTTDYRELLSDGEIDAIMVCTRHAAHAEIVLAALDAGKHVFVEKPMTTTVPDGKAVAAKVDESGLVLRVGFNRRFSPHLHAMRRAIGTEGPRLFSVRVNVGTLTSHWSNTAEEGGRFLGEAVHFLDLANWFLDQEPDAISATMVGDRDALNPNMLVQTRYPDGSAAHVVYTALGAPQMGKEYYEAFGHHRSATSLDYKSTRMFSRRRSRLRLRRGDKGQIGVLEEFAAAILGHDYPVAGADARAGLVATAMALAAIDEARNGHASGRCPLEFNFQAPYQ